MGKWVKKLSRTHNRHYYFNTETKDAEWEKPEDYVEFRASHILLKHVGSRRPMNYKQENITRSKTEAMEQLMELRQVISNSEIDFATAALEYSDCSSARKHGDLGFFGEGQMQKAFEDGVKALRVGEMSEVVETASGLHIILRTA
ncbi:hypothetical protein PCE1_003769 [Barthelona sp. PCE]